MVFAIDYQHIADKAECSWRIKGDETIKADFATLDECAVNCRGLSDIFVYGTNKYGNNKCFNGKCRCICELNTIDGKCVSKTKHNGYMMYAFTGELL